MSNNPESHSADQDHETVDPDVRRFVDAINAAYASHADRGSEGMAARREVAELVRKDWQSGGPVMAKTIDLEMQGLRLRMYRPTLDAVLPVMLYIHGGGWTLFSIDTHDRLMREYAARSGVAVIGIDYSLSPESKFPAALEEIAAALVWITEHADELGVDPQHILVGGDSAGANLSVAVNLLRRDRGQDTLAGMILNYGAFCPLETDSYSLYNGPGFSLETDEMHQFWANYVTHESDLANPLVAPLRAELHGLPPAHLAIAECDILADCNHAMAEKLAAAGVPVTAVTYRGATHSFLEAVSIAPLADRALADQAAWIRDLIASNGN